MKRMMAITISPGAVTAAVRLIVSGKAWPIIPPPAATRTRKNVPRSSENRRRHSWLRVVEVLDRVDDRRLEPLPQMCLLLPPPDSFTSPTLVVVGDPHRRIESCRGGRVHCLRSAPATLLYVSYDGSPAPAIGSPFALGRRGSVWLPPKTAAIDHVVVLMFENRSFDNVLGRLYEPGEVASFEGVLGKELSNPIPPWAEHGAERKVVDYGVAENMNTPDPDPGEEYQHVNTQLFGIVDPRRQPGGAGREDGRAVQRTAVRDNGRRWTGSSRTTSARSPRRWADSPPTTSTPRS